MKIYYLFFLYCFSSLLLEASHQNDNKSFLPYDLWNTPTFFDCGLNDTRNDDANENNGLVNVNPSNNVLTQFDPYNFLEKPNKEAPQSNINPIKRPTKESLLKASFFQTKDNRGVRDEFVLAYLLGNDIDIINDASYRLNGYANRYCEQDKRTIHRLAYKFLKFREKNNFIDSLFTHIENGDGFHELIAKWIMGDYEHPEVYQWYDTAQQFFILCLLCEAGVDLEESNNHFHINKIKEKMVEITNQS